MKSEKVCVDASLVVALFIPERFSRAALDLWQKWMEQECQPVAPLLLQYEVTSAIYRKALQGLIAREDERAMLEQSVKLDIDFVDSPSLSLRAAELAEHFQRPNAYDAHYLALAEHFDCALWTGDERLYNAVHQEFGQVHWLGNRPVNA